MMTCRGTRIVVLIGLVCWLLGAAVSAEDPAPDLLPPTDEPEVFAPDVVSLLGQAYREGEVSVWPDNGRLIFSRFGPGIPDFTIFESSFVGGAWTNPVPTDLFEDSIAAEPGLAPDGTAVFFSLPTSGVHGTHEIYVIEQINDGWSEPQRLFRGLYPSVTHARTIYYTTYVGWKDHIACRYVVDGQYASEQVIGAPVYSTHEDAHPCVAPDGSYVVFDSFTRPCDGACKLFVSFHNDDRTWTEPANLGPVVGDLPAAMARVSADGTTLFFKADGDVYWIHTSAIETLRE